jgi:hypothetical protein
MKPWGAAKKPKRTPITRAALEAAISEAVKEANPQCEGFIGVIVERIIPVVSGGANWAVKGVKYGNAARGPCSAEISKCVEERQREFEISD